MPSEEWNQMMGEWGRAWAEQLEVLGRLSEHFSRSGILDERDLNRLEAINDKLDALRKEQRASLDTDRPPVAKGPPPVASG